MCHKGLSSLLWVELHFVSKFSIHGNVRELLYTVSERHEPAKPGTFLFNRSEKQLLSKGLILAPSQDQQTSISVTSAKTGTLAFLVSFGRGL